MSQRCSRAAVGCGGRGTPQAADLSGYLVVQLRVQVVEPSPGLGVLGTDFIVTVTMTPLVPFVRTVTFRLELTEKRQNALVGRGLPGSAQVPVTSTRPALFDLADFTSRLLALRGSFVLAFSGERTVSGSALSGVTAADAGEGLEVPVALVAVTVKV